MTGTSQTSCQLAESNHDRCIEILNVQYGVFLGVILSLSFFIDSAKAPVIRTAIDLQARPEAILFAVYFLLDWFTANVVQRREWTPHRTLLFRVGWIVVLGATVLAMNAEDPWKYWLVALYLLVTSIYDIYFTYRLVASRPTGQAVIAWALACAGVMSLVFYVVFTTVGMWAYVEGINESATATVAVVSTSVSDPWLLGIVVGAFFAAVLSSADTFINNVSVFMTRLFCPHLWETAKQSDEKSNQLLFVSRLFALVAAVLAATFAWISRDIVDLLVGAFTLLIMFLPTVLATFVIRWQSERAAFYSGFAGVVAFVPLFILWEPKLAFAPAVSISIAVFAAVAGLSGPDRESERAKSND